MRERIFITTADFNKLKRLVAGRHSTGVDANDLNELEQELERAEILEDGLWSAKRLLRR